MSKTITLQRGKGRHSIDILKAARRLISDKKNWSEKYAVDKYGEPVEPWSERAVKWNLMGALSREGKDILDDSRTGYHLSMLEAVYFTIYDLYDELFFYPKHTYAFSKAKITQETALDLIDAAIVKYEQWQRDGWSMHKYPPPDPIKWRFATYGVLPYWKPRVCISDSIQI